MSRRGERDGKGLEGAVAFAKEMERVGATVARLSARIRNLQGDGIYITSIKLLERGSDADEWLAIMGADTNDGKKVAFHSAGTLIDALTGISNKLLNNTLKWKDDQYAK